MIRATLICLMLLFTGCANKAHYIIPDKFAVQFNTDPNKHGSEIIDQLRFGLVWDIPN